MFNVDLDGLARAASDAISTQLALTKALESGEFARVRRAGTAAHNAEVAFHDKANTATILALVERVRNAEKAEAECDALRVELKALRVAVETAERESSLRLFAGRPDSETLIDLRAKLHAALEPKP